MTKKYNYDLTKLYNGLDHFGIAYSDEQIDKLIHYYEMVVEKNKFMNITAITDFYEFVDKHFIDSLSLESVYPKIKDEINVMDVGTGGGFPGIPLAIMYENANFTLLDSLTKRITFIDDVIHELSLENVNAIAGRAEDYGKDSSYREQYDLCVTRAVAEINLLSEFTLPFVKVGGNLIAYKSSKLSEELTTGKNAISILGGEVNQTVQVDIPGTDYERNLLIIDKINSTPNKYPRKAGIPKKRPLS